MRARRKFNKGYSAKTRVATLIVLVALILAGLWAKANVVFANNVVYSSQELPKQFVGFKIAHVSDLSNDSANVESAVKRAKPDIVIVTGGYADDKGNVKDSIRALNKLGKIAPTYYVFSQSDIDTGVVEQVKSSVTEAKNLDGTILNITTEPVELEDYAERVYGKWILKDANKGDETAIEALSVIGSSIEADAGKAIGIMGISSLIGSTAAYDAEEQVGNMMVQNGTDYNVLALGNHDLFSQISNTQVSLTLSGGATEAKPSGEYTENGATEFISRGVSSIEGKKFLDFRSINVITLSDGTLQELTPFEIVLREFIHNVDTIVDTEKELQGVKQSYDNESINRGDDFSKDTIIY